MMVFEFTKFGLFIFSTFLLGSGCVLGIVLMLFGEKRHAPDAKPTYEPIC